MGVNALHFAAPVAEPEVVSTLLEAGADPNAVTIGGMTTLQLAVRGTPGWPYSPHLSRRAPTRTCQMVKDGQLFTSRPI